MKPLYRLPADVQDRRRDVRRSLALALGFNLLAIWIATQYAADRLGYHRILGDPLVRQTELSGPLLLLIALLLSAACVALLCQPHLRRLAAILAPWPAVLCALARGDLFPPFQFLRWWKDLRHLPLSGAVLQPAGEVLFLFASTSLAAVLVFALFSAANTAKPDVYGSARWATARDLRSTRLLRPMTGNTVVGHQGLFLGCVQEGSRRRAMYEDGDTHVFVFAPTRSGKGVGLVVPNLLLWKESALVIDIKSENYNLTAGARRRELGNLILRFDPTSAGSSRYNPLLEVRLGNNEVRDAQNIADILVDPNGDRTRDHWDRTAHALLTAVILHVLYTQEDKTLRGCALLLSRPGMDVAKTLKAMVETRHLEGGPHPVISSIAQAVLDKAAEERSGVISTALSFLDLYRDPLIAQNTGASDFRIQDLMQLDQPVTLYLTLPPSDLSRTRPLVRLLLNQVCRRLTEELRFSNGRPAPHYRHRLLLMMDEFPALGKLHFFSESLAYLAGYGIRAFLVAQDIAQLHSTYGRQESITANCHVRIAFTPNKPETAELLSQMVGQTTVHQDRRTRRAGGPLSAGGSVTPSESQRRLITPDEAMRLPPDETLVFIAGLPPIRGRKLPYFRDPALSQLAAIPPEASSRSSPDATPVS